MKALFWVQHLLGIGHVRRAQALVGALQERGIQTLVAQGGFDVPGVDFHGADILKLPPLRAADAEFSGLADEEGNPPDEKFWAERSDLLHQSLEKFDPDILITETFPFGRRGFRTELIPLLEAAEAKNTLIISSVRDVLVGKSQPKKEQWMADQATKFYHQVIVHGDPDLIPFGQTFPHAEQIDKLLYYSGYIGPSGSIASHPASPQTIIVSGGGGAVSSRLFRAVLDAIPGIGPANFRWRFLIGPDLPQTDRQDLIRQASDLADQVQIEPAVPSLAKTLAGTRLSISQAGYNTIMDILAANAPALVIPFSEGGESEQAIRARALADRGRLTVYPASQLGHASNLAETINKVVMQPPPPAVPVMMDGAKRSADRIHALAQQRAASHD